MADEENRLCNDNDRKYNERTHISINKQTKYGTNSKADENKKIVSEDKELYIKYEVLNEDTLVSIALKYELKVSQLKSINRLWNSNIIPGQYIFIPLTNAETDSSCVQGELLTMIEVKRLLNNCNDLLKYSPEKINAVNSLNDKNNLTINDYFRKFDSNFTQLKDNVERFEKESNLKTINEEISKGQMSPINNTVDVNTEPELKFIAKSKSSKALQMHRKHEMRQEDLFQL